MALIDSTLLAITGITIPEYAIRGLKLYLQLETADGALRRSINGELLDLTSEQFHNKYSATLSCEDQDVPTLTGVRQGLVVTITCIIGVGPGPVTLTMMVTGWTTSRAEWDALTDWTIELLQV